MMGLNRKESGRCPWGGKAAGALLLAFAGFFTLQPASAAVIDLDTYVSGDPANPGTASVAKLTLTQNGSSVDFKLENFVNNLPGSLGDDAFISLLRFSFDGDPPITASSFGNFGGSQLISQSSVSINPSGADVGYRFYLAINFPVSNNPNANPNRFVHGEISTWSIAGVNESDFLSPVSGNGPPALAMVHIQQVGSGPGGEDSLKYIGTAPGEVPEPATVALFGLGLLGMAAVRKRRRK